MKGLDVRFDNFCFGIIIIKKSILFNKRDGRVYMNKVKVVFFSF